MDNFIDSFLSSSSWSNMNASANLSWIGCVATQVDSLLAEPMESYQGDGKISSVPLNCPSLLTENVSSDNLNAGHNNASSFPDRSVKYGASEALFLGKDLLQIQQPNHDTHPSQGIEAHAGSFSTPGPAAQNSTSVSLGVDSNISLPHNALTISNSIENNGNEPPSFDQSLGAHSVSSSSVYWPSSFPTISTLSGEEKVQNFSLQGMANGTNYMGEASSEMGYPTTAAGQNEHNSTFATFSGQTMKMTNGETDLQNLPLACFSDESHVPFSTSIGMLTNLQSEGSALKQQLSHSSSAQQQIMTNHFAQSNVATKPRVRARRGQATDPHSIAERLRREKIAERMKNLQELVPNSNKTDKASMLDEIIDYVKFLQLQVKVLSMSRLGATGAVVPLITDARTEDTRSLRLSPVSQGVDLLESEDNLAFEQEVVKLMESNITTAMQYLQNKGLCLMPIALANAISNQKGSVAANPSDRRTPEMSESKDSGDEVNHCIGDVVKQEDVP